MKYESLILEVNNSHAYQQLKDYYSSSTLFSTLGIARSENRHSAFIAWLLDTIADHKLGCEPLKKLLGIYAVKSGSLNNTLRSQLITGRYSLSEVNVETEKTLSSFGYNETLTNKLNRLDIVCSFTLVPYDENSTEDNSIKAILVIENKIYSKEGKHSGRMQTEIYHDALTCYCRQYGLELFEIFLSPDEAVKPTCTDYCNMNYQELLDSVIMPLSTMKTDEHTSFLLSDYIRNLGVPALNMDENGNPKDDYSILATSKTEVQYLQELYSIKGFADLFFYALLAKFESKAFKLQYGDKIGKQAYSEIEDDEHELLSQFWDANANVFQAMIRSLRPFGDQDTSFIFKNSNRDNSRYRVKLNGQYIFPHKPSLSKAMTALAIFHAYVEKSGMNMTVHELNGTFPCKDLNDYYYKNYYKDIFSKYSPDLTFTADNKKHHGKPSKAIWDFYVKPEQLMTINNGTTTVMAVKMWRKNDFDKLVEYIKNDPEFSGIEIEQVI